MENPSLRDIDILCRVIDNYGDAGVVWRLAKALGRLEDRTGKLELRIFTDQPDIFFRLGADQTIPVFGLREWDQAPPAWNGRAAGTIIQAFDAAIPEFYRLTLAGDAGDSAGRTHLLINLEYLSAEDWTREYHLLPSLSGMEGVEKVFFLPGFIEGTGGLIWSETPPPTSLRKGKAREHMARLVLQKGPGNDPAHAVPAEVPLHGQFWISLFSYEHDYLDLVTALAGRVVRDRGFRPVVLLAPGRSAQGFLEPWERSGRPFPVVLLPFLAQKDYDWLIDSCDFNIVRGEESLARAALSGTPFIWHAYLQEDRHQLVKVRALLETMKPRFGQADFDILESAFMSFNDRESDGLTSHTSSGWQALIDLAASPDGQTAFMECTKKLSQLGDLTENLLSMITRSR